MRNHFKHSVELVDGEGDIVDVLAAVEEVARSVRCPREGRRLMSNKNI